MEVSCCETGLGIGSPDGRTADPAWRDGLGNLLCAQRPTCRERARVVLWLSTGYKVLPQYELFGANLHPNAHILRLNGHFFSGMLWLGPLFS